VFFQQLRLACRHPVEKDGVAPEDDLDEMIIVLNGDIVDVIRSSRWARAGVYPWNRDHPRFPEIVVDIMRDIVVLHADEPRVDREGRPYSGFFYWMRDTVDWLRAQGVKVTIIPIVGNHDKELQVVSEARRLFYEECLGLHEADIPASYRAWVAQQLGTSPDETWPQLPVYFADQGLRLFATHGQWRDADNIRATSGWRFTDGWRPQRWRREKYLAFSQPCFGDTVAAGMLSYFIWTARENLPTDSPKAARIGRILDEMDLYRPTVKAVVCFLKEARSLARSDPAERNLRDVILRSYSDSLKSWLSHKETWKSASPKMRVILTVLKCLRGLKWSWIDLGLMKLMAKAQEPETSIETCAVLKLPAFHTAYRDLGLRLHVEGHTHVALEAEVRFAKPKERPNYLYVNLGAWRDAIVPKRNGSQRRRGIARAMHVFDLARLKVHKPHMAYRYYTIDMLSWSDRRDRW
jgi:hypothetical protein